MARNIPVFMNDDFIDKHVIRKVPKAHQGFTGKKYRINNQLWRKYLEAQENFELLLNKVLNERIVIHEATASDEED
jgi:hypothetical protein